MRDPNAVIYLVPGVGMISFAKDTATARIAAEFYVNAINVMRGASGVDRYVGLAEQEAFDIEYWQLEEAKLQRMPKPRAMQGRVALVTGGAGGIGSAIARRMLAEGACVVLADIDAAACDAVVKDLSAAYGKDFRPRRHARRDARGGGRSRLRRRGARLWRARHRRLQRRHRLGRGDRGHESRRCGTATSTFSATGYFLAARAAFRVMKRQGNGGSIIFIVSKNGLAASPGASAYCAAKALELHLARCLALEGAPHGIRVNSVNPDAVLRGSKIWQGEWRDQRAQSNKVTVDELEEVYRQRSLLKLSVYPEDIAEAAYFLASDAASKSTGNIINVDAGNAVSFTR